MDVKALRAVVAQLEQAYARARADIEREIKREGHEDLHLPELKQDQHGRYLLLDALIAITNARAALINASDLGYTQSS